jgi:hypothetical protein
MRRTEGSQPSAEGGGGGEGGGGSEGGGGGAVVLMSDLIHELLTCESILKLGFDFSNDISRLRASFPTLACFDCVAPFLDGVYQGFIKALLRLC